MLSKRQREYLRAQAQNLRPLVMVGKGGVSATLVKALDEVLTAHELVKLKFIDHKDEKAPIAGELAEQTGSEIVTTIGHMVVFFRQHPEPQNRRYVLPNE